MFFIISSLNHHVASYMLHIQNPSFTVIVVQRVCIIEDSIGFKHWARDKWVALCNYGTIRKAGRKGSDEVYKSEQRYGLHYDVTLCCFQQIQIVISFNQEEQLQLLTWHIKLVSFTIIFFLFYNCIREWTIYKLLKKWSLCN